MGAVVHELGITRNIVAIVMDQAHGARVKRVAVEIGKLSAVMPDAIRFCFDICSKGTPLEGAELELREIEGRGRCEACGETLALPRLGTRCACGSARVACLAGQELLVKEMETF